MNWELRHLGGTIEQRLKKAERNGVTLGEEINNLRYLDRTARMLFNGLSHFMDSVSKLPEVKHSKVKKQITVSVKVINSKTFNTNTCIAWIKKANTNCYGQCGKKLKEGHFCGFHCASKQHSKPITTIYDNIDLHTLYENKCSVTLIPTSSSSCCYSSNHLDECIEIFWKNNTIYLNTNTNEMFCKVGKNLKLIGCSNEDEDKLYDNLLELLSN